MNTKEKNNEDIYIMQNDIFSVKEVADYLHISQSSVRKLIRNNKIPHYRILSRIFFNKEKIDYWIENSACS